MMKKMCGKDDEKNVRKKILTANSNIHEKCVWKRNPTFSMNGGELGFPTAKEVM